MKSVCNGLQASKSSGRRGGRLVKGAYLSAWPSSIKCCDGRLTQLYNCWSTAALLLLTVYGLTLLQLLWELHTALESKWKKLFFPRMLHVVLLLLVFRRRKMSWILHGFLFPPLLHNCSWVRAAGRRKKRGKVGQLSQISWWGFSIKGRSAELNCCESFLGEIVDFTKTTITSLIL